MFPWQPSFGKHVFFYFLFISIYFTCCQRILSLRYSPLYSVSHVLISQTRAKRHVRSCSFNSRFESRDSSENCFFCCFWCSLISPPLEKPYSGSLKAFSLHLNAPKSSCKLHWNVIALKSAFRRSFASVSLFLATRTVFMKIETFSGMRHVRFFFSEVGGGTCERWLWRRHSQKNKGENGGQVKYFC